MVTRCKLCNAIIVMADYDDKEGTKKVQRICTKCLRAADRRPPNKRRWWDKFFEELDTKSKRDDILPG